MTHANLTREEMTAELVEVWLADASVKHLDELAREALAARYAANYDLDQLAAEYAELLGDDA